MNQNTIAPWLSVRDGEKAVSFYKEAFGAIEKYRLENPGEGLVVKLAINGAEFWLSSEAKENTNGDPETLGGNSIRMILITANPETLFDTALKAGATEVFPIGEDHGWKLGRLTDPFGLDWEIGYEL